MNASRVYSQLPPAPTSAGDIEAAQRYHQAIADLLFQDDVAREQRIRGGPFPAECLTRAERANLQRLERVWSTRAIGADRRWNLYGSRAGRLKRTIEESLRPAPAEDWTRPLERGEDGRS
jgi:hypothetical protein